MLQAMGFPSNYIDYALVEVGTDAQPDQIVSWMLEHANIQV